MFEVKDPKIKLFGKTIELPEISAGSAAAESGGAGGSVQSSDAVGEDASNQDPPCSSDSMLEDSNFNGDTEEQESDKNLSGPKQTDGKENNRAQPLTSEELKESNVTPSINEDSKAALSTDSDVGPMKTSKSEEDQNESSNSQDKTLKKPDKILPCPRCNSMDTKFCYFNNYNVSQPRHFCKNCQRYWTAGGTMRNVPVGAGRRKNKNVTPQFRHLTVNPEALQGARVNPNGTVLTFSSDAPLCESMASVLNIADKKGKNFSRNGFHQPEENGDDHSNGSSVTGPISKDEMGAKASLPHPMPNCHPFPPQLPVFPGAPWPYPFPPPTYGPTSFPLPFYPTGPPPPYWGCAIPATWNVPWVIPPTPTSPGPNSPTLGKHSREDGEEKTQKESNSEKCLWIPKTLRIDDPGEAAKSSIWKTLGINNDRANCVGGGGGGGLFKAFQSQSKGDDDKAHTKDTSTVLQANPAALSRSVSFHESS
ncbi:hypothetical protein ACJIZ3_014655 [Penstemon smallii]|uniref:Dof-type domain-containing protein n=1 Tax=Penstemon smallii TaxID=265156 RepID=A0ABD3RK74_9LAMI